MVGAGRNSQNDSWTVQCVVFPWETSVCWWRRACPASLAPLDLLGSISIGLISFESPGAFSITADGGKALEGGAHEV